MIERGKSVDGAEWPPCRYPSIRQHPPRIFSPPSAAAPRLLHLLLPCSHQQRQQQPPAAFHARQPPLSTIGLKGAFTLQSGPWVYGTSAYGLHRRTAAIEYDELSDALRAAPGVISIGVRSTFDCDTPYRRVARDTSTSVLRALLTRDPGCRREKLNEAVVRPESPADHRVNQRLGSNKSLTW